MNIRDRIRILITPIRLTPTNVLVGTLVVGGQEVTIPPNQAGSDPKDSGDYVANTCPSNGTTRPITQWYQQRRRSQRSCCTYNLLRSC